MMNAIWEPILRCWHWTHRLVKCPSWLNRGDEHGYSVCLFSPSQITINSILTLMFKGVEPRSLQSVCVSDWPEVLAEALLLVTDWTHELYYSLETTFTDFSAGRRESMKSPTHNLYKNSKRLLLIKHISVISTIFRSGHKRYSPLLCRISLRPKQQHVEWWSSLISSSCKQRFGGEREVMDRKRNDKKYD